MNRLFAAVLAVLMLSLSACAFAHVPHPPEPAETSVVRSHDRVPIFTDVSRGINEFRRWAEFPASDEQIRRITMHLTLAHPDTGAIAHWDYLGFINVRRTGGQHGEPLNMEIGRKITPYGSSFNDDWSFTWQVDVTDFSMILRDSVEIEYIHTGYEPPHLSWDLTIDFEFTHGPPAADPLSVTEVYNGRYPYGRPGDPIENYLKPFEFSFHDEAAFARLRVQHTGHGADRPNMCSEFCSRWREVHFNARALDRIDLWKECGFNPLYPQGGTWIHDRGYWCPGELQDPDLYDVPASPGTHTWSIVMEPYEAEANIQAEEIIGAYLIQYGAPRERYDVAVERIEVPGRKDQYSRENPAVFRPVVVFRNMGSEPVTELRIVYGTEGFAERTYTWRGHLPHNGRERVELPGRIDFNRGENRFYATLSGPNGQRDAWPADNHATSLFDAPKELPLQFVVQYKANNRPEDNHLFVLDSNADTLYLRTPAMTQPNEVYRDTVQLDPGTYEFYLTDAGGDGLEFWARPQQGYGYVRLLDMHGQIVHHFLSDSGSGQFLAFHAVADPEPDLSVSPNAFFLYPRRTARHIDLDAFLPQESRLKVRFLRDGQTYASHEYHQFTSGTVTFDIATLPEGRYIVEIFVDDELVHRNRINRDAPRQRGRQGQ